MKARLIYKKFLVGIMAAAMVFSVFGCTLAVEGKGTEEKLSQDKMIGVFITTRDLELMDYDWDAYFEEHIDDFINGIEVGTTNSSQGEKRIYATIDKRVNNDAFEWDIYFDGIEGICFFEGMHQYGDGAPFQMLTADDGVCDIATHYSSTDNGDSMELEATIYVIPSMYNSIQYVNPVYQTPTGEIYVATGTMGNHIGNLSATGKLAVTIADEVKLTENGVTETNKTSVKITYQGEYEPTEILVHQMDENNIVVKTEKYVPGSLPEEMKAEDETAYIIVETRKNNPENPDESTREIYCYNECGYTYFETFCITENGRLGKMTTRIEW